MISVTRATLLQVRQMEQLGNMPSSSSSPPPSSSLSLYERLIAR